MTSKTTQFITYYSEQVIQKKDFYLFLLLLARHVPTIGTEVK